MHRIHRSPLLVAAAALVSVAACRPMVVETDPGPAYTVEVHNPMTHPMIVHYEDARGRHLLGTVSAESRGRFVISNPADIHVRIIATDEARTHTVQQEVTLRAEAAAQVTLTR
jgi:hypothetical protein